MAEAGKTSFLGSITSWSRSSTPPPKSPRHPPPKDDSLKKSAGADHATSLRPNPSLKRYPRDCPPLKTRWYYAIDVAKRKPFAPAQDDKPKASPSPKKWVLFSTSDSQAIESAFLGLDRGDEAVDESKPTSTKIAVNEDYLFDVHIEKRELEPAYWLGPVYEVRRGSWFYSDSSGLRPCEENLANQLEEGYLRVAPWRRTGQPRSASQPRPRPSSAVIAGGNAEGSSERIADVPLSNTHRLFGTHMNTTVTYHDASVAFMSTDDFMSRIGSTVYTRFGGQSGTKVVRGYSEVKAAETKATETKSSDAKSKLKSNVDAEMGSTDVSTQMPATENEPAQSRPSALERQLSSLAGLVESKDEQKLAEEDAQKAQEQEMEDAREKDGDDQARRVDHLVLVTHGIGQRLGLRLDSINFVHDVNTMRKTLKGVYATAPDLQALTGDPRNSTIQVLPLCWRHLLDFPRQSLRQNRKEFDLGDMDSRIEDEYPSLQDITVEGVPAVRNLITDLAMDVLLYQSAYREHIASIVVKEANRILKLFKQRTGFQGKVSLCGHSLGSAILFDILCRQESMPLNRPRRVSSRTSREIGQHLQENRDLRLDFDCENFFALGSPIALFQMLKGRTIAGRQSLHDKAPLTSPFSTDNAQSYPFSAGVSGTTLIPITVSSPKCGELFNIFHPTDPIAYRMEPLISPTMAQLKSQPLPYVKKGLFGAPGIANMTARVGQQVMSSWYSLTSGVASSLINRSLGITGEEQALPQDRRTVMATQPQSPQLPTPPTVTGTAPVSSGRKQADLARTLSDPLEDGVDSDSRVKTSKPNPTLIDSEIETLYSGFQKRQNRRLSQSSTHSTKSDSATVGTDRNREADHEQDSVPTPGVLHIDELSEAEKSRKLRREEAKVRALNTNGRVDYHIQEGMFDVSLLASIASHLSYWADEDVNHFMVGQMLKRGPVNPVEGDVDVGTGGDGSRQGSVRIRPASLGGGTGGDGGGTGGEGVANAEQDRRKTREDAMIGS